MYVITAHQRYGQTDRRTSSDPMTATLLKHVAVKSSQLFHWTTPLLCIRTTSLMAVSTVTLTSKFTGSSPTESTFISAGNVTGQGTCSPLPPRRTGTGKFRHDRKTLNSRSTIYVYLLLLHQTISNVLGEYTNSRGNRAILLHSTRCFLPNNRINHGQNSLCSINESINQSIKKFCF